MKNINQNQENYNPKFYTLTPNLPPGHIPVHQVAVLNSKDNLMSQSLVMHDCLINVHISEQN